LFLNSVEVVINDKHVIDIATSLINQRVLTLP